MRNDDATTILSGEISQEVCDHFTPNISVVILTSVLLMLWKIRIRRQCRNDAMWSKQCVPQKNCLSFSRIMSHSHLCLLDLPPFSHPQLLTSPLLPSCGDHQPPDPRTAGLFGRHGHVHSRKWRFVTCDVIIFSSLFREEAYSTFKQNCWYSDRQWYRGLRHASKSQHQGTWRLSIGRFGERFVVSAIVGKTVQWAWWFFFVAVKRNSQILKR